ncbi:MAG: thiamine pyrophosphate-binding protein [Myxococcota bacterium]
MAHRRPSRRPHLLIGAAARGESLSIVRLAERLDAPVATTPHARGLFPDSHPLALGVFGVGAHPSAIRALTQTADCVLALGTDLGELASGGFNPKLGKEGPLIQVHPDTDALARGYAVEWAVRAPVGPVVRDLVQQLAQRRPSNVATRLERLPLAAGGGSGIHPAEAVQRIQDLLPVDTIFAVDSGEHTFFAMQYLHLDLPDSWYALLGLGSMGAGVCGALGLALAAPARTVACLCGDGGLLMHLGELSTAAQVGLPIRWFVFNDRRLGMVVHGQEGLFGRSHAFDHGDVDLASAATSLGVTAIELSTLDELAAHADLIADPGGPLVVVLNVDPTLSMPKGGRLASLGEGLSEVPS